MNENMNFVVVARWLYHCKEGENGWDKTGEDIYKQEYMSEWNMQS